MLEQGKIFYFIYIWAPKTITRPRNNNILIISVFVKLQRFSLKNDLKHKVFQY